MRRIGLVLPLVAALLLSIGAFHADITSPYTLAVTFAPWLFYGIVLLALGQLLDGREIHNGGESHDESQQG